MSQDRSRITDQAGSPDKTVDFFDPADDKLREECGVFGIFGMDNAASLTALGLHALQHRGQEACGIASVDGIRFHAERHMGLVGDNFTGDDPSERLKGHAAIGHVRYSTAGETVLRNVQPLYSELNTGGFALAHNGHITNAFTIREQLVEDGAIFQSTSDTEVVIHLTARAKGGKFIDRFIDALRQIDGGFAFVGLTKKSLIGARDRLGIRPLLIGRLGENYLLASETCALDMISAEFIREVDPGEVVVINADGIRSFRAYPEVAARPCVFEFVYFARPDSVVGGKSVYEVRKRMGQRLAQETPADVDVIIPVPDSGVPAALGYAQETGIPFELGIIRNHYVGRTFIAPTQQIRDMGVRLKHSANRAMIEGKRVLLVDDSIVRGTTSTKIVRMIKAAGAKEVHFRSASPPIKFPDHYGIDMPTTEKLIAANYGLEAMRQMLEVDSLGFLSIEGLYWAMGEQYRSDTAPQYTDHCFTGHYPTPLTDVEREKAGKSAKQLSFLVEVA
ncbi:amidophosphoribosyltransferase [Robiginitomaculum antarcticum]|uniref:amidophosphoribosyltransferase n=1 Tax=Robiginitomaculum antarcticum TaxID=437507 RepID=UPI00036CF55E|nr:amidophosphoribosyltransferase [Robiginitomaculum antarcticum]